MTILGATLMLRLVACVSLDALESISAFSSIRWETVAVQARTALSHAAGEDPPTLQKGMWLQTLLPHSIKPS